MPIRSIFETIERDLDREKRMNNKTMLAIGVLGLAALSNGQKAIGPFIGSINEGFEKFKPGVTSVLSIFNDTTTIGATKLAVNQNAAILPPYAGTKSVFGDGADIELIWNGCISQFGAYFRAAKSGVTSFRIDCYDWYNTYRGSATATVSGSSWAWRGWSLPATWLIYKIKVVSLAATPGYVAIDNATFDWL